MRFALADTERHENCVDDNWWSLNLHLSKCINDPDASPDILKRKKWDGWIPVNYTLAIWDFQYWRWN